MNGQLNEQTSERVAGLTQRHAQRLLYSVQTHASAHTNILNMGTRYSHCFVQDGSPAELVNVDTKDINGETEAIVRGGVLNASTTPERCTSRSVPEAWMNVHLEAHFSISQVGVSEYISSNCKLPAID